jgi:hypothetical protein
LQYEQLRRKIETQARELSYFTTDQLNKITEKLSEDDKPKWRNVISRFADQSRSVPIRKKPIKSIHLLLTQLSNFSEFFWLLFEI